MKGRSLVVRLASLLAVVAVATAPLFSQAFYASVVGILTDLSGGALSGGVVTLTNLATGERRQAQSGTSGDYQFLNLVPGKYCVEVEQKGFISGTIRADIAMQLGGVSLEQL